MKYTKKRFSVIKIIDPSQIYQLADQEKVIIFEWYFLSLGRRMMKLIELINDFKTKGIKFILLVNNIETTNQMGMLLFTMCAAFAEMERTLITERVKAGLDAAYKKDIMGG